MAEWFHPDSKIMGVLGKAADLLLLNLLFLLCCLPVVTTGAALTGLFDAVRALEEEEGKVYAVFFSTSRKKFKEATLVFVLQMFILGILIGEIVLLNEVSFPGKEALLVLQGMLLLVFLAISVTVYPVLTSWDGPLKGLMKETAGFLMLHFPRVILVILVHGVQLVLTVLIFTVLPSIFLYWTIIGGSLSVLYTGKILGIYSSVQED